MSVPLMGAGALAGGGAFSPDTVAGLVGWWKADAITGLNDADPVVTWEDSHTSNRDLTQGTAANRPTYQTNEQNGKPIVSFDGSNDQLAYQNSTEFITGTGLTLAVVYKIRSNVAGKRVVGLTNDTDGKDWDNVRSMRLLENAGPTEIHVQRSAIVTKQTIPTAGTWMVHLFWTDGTNANHRYNGAAANVDSQTPSADSWSVGWVGLGAGWHLGAADGPGQYDVAEVCLWDNDIGTTARGDLETYLNGKWAVY